MNEAQVIKINSQALRNKAQVPKNKSWIIRNELHELINEAQSIRNNSQVIRNELHELINEAHVIRNNSQSLRNKAQALRDKDITIPKTENKNMLDKINNKISTINETSTILAEIKVKLKNKYKLIYKSICELQDEIYSDDSWLRLVELNKIDAIIDDALNVIWNEIYGENRISSKIINIDKYKDIDGYVSKLTDVIDNKIELLNRVSDSIDHIISDIKNETNMFDEKIYKAYEKGIDHLHLINCKLKEIMIQLKQNLKNILVWQIYNTNNCAARLWGEYLQQKHKIIV